MLLSMNENPVVFALANPRPEISYELATATRKDIIFGRLSGFGPVGPDADLPPIDELAAARTGEGTVL